MARKWKPRPVGAVLTRLAGSARGPAPTPLAFRRTADGSVEYRRQDGSTGRASYWAALGAGRLWGVDVDLRTFVALELHTTAAGADWSVIHRDNWDTARGESFEIVESPS